MFQRAIYLFLAFCFFCIPASGQQDSLTVKKGPLLVGECKGMSKTGVVFGTPYSTTPLSIKWDHVLHLTTTRYHFRVFDINGHLYYGKLKIDSLHKDSLLVIGKDSSYTLAKKNLQQADSYETDRLGTRLKLKADLGYTLLKQNKTQQFSFGVNGNFLTPRWEFGMDFLVFAAHVDTIRNFRGNLSGTVRYRLPHNWFLMAQPGFAFSSEQDLSSRITLLLGSGKYLLLRHKTGLNLSAGILYNQEKYSIATTTFTSTEAFAMMNYQLTPFKNATLAAQVIASPSLTEKGRFRTYAKSDITYAISSHFLIGVNYVLQDDSKPPVNAKRNDYAYNLKFGWVL